MEDLHQLVSALEDAKHLEKLKSVIEGAIADGRVTTQEMQAIKTIIWSDGKVSP